MNEQNMNEHFCEAFPTLFLPLELPSLPLAEKTRGKKTDRASIMKCWLDFLAKKDLEGSLLVDVAASFVDLHVEDRVMQPQCVRKSLEKTKVGDYWACHVRAQNAAILLRRETRHKAIFMAWQVQSPNHDVTNNAFIHQTIPQVLLTASWKALTDETFIETLCDLTEREQLLAQPVTRKAGGTFHETREANNPFFVLDVLASALGGEALPEEQLEAFIMEKKMRDEVRYEKSELPWRREPVYAVLKSVLHLVCFLQTRSNVDYKVLMQKFLMFCLDNVGKGKVSDSSLVEASRKLARRGEKLRLESQLDPPVMAVFDEHLEGVARRALEDVKSDWERSCTKPNRADFDIPLADMEDATVHSLPNSGALLKRLSCIAMDKGGDLSAGACLSQAEDVACPEEFRRHRDWSPFRVDDIQLQISLLESAMTTQLGSSPQDFIGTVNDVSMGILGAFEVLKNDDPALVNDVSNRFLKGSLVPVGALKKVNGPASVNEGKKGIYEQGDDPAAVAGALIMLQKKLIEIGLGLKDGKKQSPFEGDVRAKSQVILVAFTICLLIDQLACREHPLSREHKLGVPTTAWMDNLSLPSVDFRIHLCRVEAYLKQREKAKGPPSLESNRSEQSFAVQFAKNAPDMEKARSEILKKCLDLRGMKQIEWKNKRSQYDQKRLEAGQIRCSCHYAESCQKCKLEREADCITICHHEKLLPDAEYAQQAVVFELMMPKILLCQREALIMFAELACNEEWQKVSDWQGYWQEEVWLLQWRNSGLNGRMMLGSERKKVSQSHYRVSKICHIRDLVVKHGYEVKAMGPEGPMIDILSWKWNLSPHTTVCVQPGPYYALQHFYNSFSHSENTVIAEKSEASEELSLHEFEEVGCLRAGPELQMERMLSGLLQHAYSLNRKEIVTLFACVLWQVGPELDNDCFRKIGQVGPVVTQDCFRKSSLILKLKHEFSPRMCKMLDAIMKDCRMNWSNHNVLLSIVYIGRHLLEHSTISQNSTAAVDCVKVLRESRIVALEWIKSLLELLHTCTDDEARQCYAEKIVDTACAGALSFLNHEDLMADAEDVHHWIFFRTAFHDNFTPNDVINQSWRRPHLFYCMEVAEKIAPRLLEVLETNVGQLGLTNFLKDYWTGSSNGVLKTHWVKCDKSFKWFSAYFEQSGRQQSQVIQVDVVGGSFLVDGFPCARLPKDICAHEIYRRFFNNAIFLVQPLEKHRYKTARPVCGFHFEFYSPLFNPSLGFGNIPIITRVKEKPGADHVIERAVKEKHGADHVIERAVLLTGDFPAIITQEYSHWFVIKAEEDVYCNKLHFRPLKYTSPLMNIPTDDYVFCYSKRLLIENKSRARFVDVNSGPFQKLYGSVFHRLSLEHFVHVKVPTGSPSAVNDVVVELPRLGYISFEYDGQSIQTHTFGGLLRVARDQNCGVFVGLKHGLLLEDPEILSNNFFLCPNGEVSRSASETTINLETPLNPPFFNYCLRSEFMDLKPTGEGRLGWLFLALLHAYTSGLIEDPFTHCMGVKRALDILQMGCCTGNLVTTMDEEILRELLLPELNLLGSIAQVSISRKDYHDMEQVSFGAHPALCAHYGFALLAANQIKAIEDSLALIGRVHMLQEKNVEQCFEGRLGPLAQKACFQRRQYYPMDGSLCTFLSDQQSSLHIDAMASPLDESFTQAVRDVGWVGQHQKCIVFTPPCLNELLGNEKKMVGRSKSIPTIGNVVHFLDRMLESRATRDSSNRCNKVFHNIWLQLYQLARCEWHDTAEGRSRFGYLMTFVAAHFPDRQGYLHQLLLVLNHRSDFPDPPKHLLYTDTEEVDLVPGHVDNLLNKHLCKFTLAEPTHWGANYSTYEQQMQRWESEKEQHCQVIQRTREDIQRCIKSRFESGGKVSQMDVNKSHILDQPVLVMELNKLFDRWRCSRDLKLFRTAVSVRTKKLHARHLMSAPPPYIFHSKTRTWPKRASFLLTTHSTAAFTIDHEWEKTIYGLSVSGQYQAAFECTPTTVSPVMHSSALNFVFMQLEMDQAEAVLCRKLAFDLETSVNQALLSPEETFEFLKDPKVASDLRLMLCCYKTAAETIMKSTWALVERAKLCASSVLPAVGL